MRSEDRTGAIACSLSPDAIRAGRAGLLPGLREQASEVMETVNGFRLTFAPSSETLLMIARAIDAERQCCRWLRFDLTVTADGGPIHLELSGPRGAQAFLREVLAM
jgi:hypothetical protein